MNTTVTVNKITNYFGNKLWIKNYWKIATPAFLWAIFVSLGPILGIVIITSLLPNNLFGLNNINLTNYYNFNIYAYSYIDILSVVFVMSSFSIVGNYIAKNDLKKLNEILKEVMYLSLLISIIVTIFVAIYASGFENLLLGFSNNNGTLNQSAIFLSWSSVSIIFYMLDWFFISSFSCLNLIWVQCWSAIIGLISYLIALVVYTLFVHNITYDNENQLNIIVRNYAILYDFWYVVQTLFIYVYCFIPSVFKLKKQNKHLVWIKQENLAYQYFYFLRSISIKLDSKIFSFYFKYAYWIMLDVVIWVIADIFSQVAGTKYYGFTNDFGIVYRLIIAVCTQYSVYLYIFFNGFGLITNSLLSIPLGKNNYNKAKNNTTRLFWWGFIIAFCLFVIVICISYALNMYLIGGINHPNQAYMIYNNLTKSYSYINYSYFELWNMAMVMDVIYGLYMFINIMFNNIYYLQLSGNSRWILFSDAFVSLIYAIVIWSLFITNNNLNNMFSWYILNKSYVLWKLAIGLIIIFFYKALNSIDSPHFLYKNRQMNIQDIQNKLTHIKIINK